MPKETLGGPSRQERKERLFDATVAFVFPGQGSQRVEMGFDLYQQSPAARRVFEEADDTLKFNLSRLIFEGPDNQLRDTVNAQPAILTVSIAALRTVQEQLGDKLTKPMLLAGHSLGEYSALVASGVLTFGDAIGLTRERGKLMQNASLERPGGGMAAIIGLSDEFALEHICSETGVEIANINSDDEIVISGDKLALARAMDLAHLRGARKTIALPVSTAFHSSFMEQVKNGLQEAIAPIHFAKPQVSIIANSTAEILTDPDKIKKELIDGVCMPVRWRQSVGVMTNAGVTSVYEFGPGRVLTSLARKIPNLNAFAINSLKSLEQFAN